MLSSVLAFEEGLELARGRGLLSSPCYAVYAPGFKAEDSGTQSCRGHQAHGHGPTHLLSASWVPSSVLSAGHTAAKETSGAAAPPGALPSSSAPSPECCLSRADRRVAPAPLDCSHSRASSLPVTHPCTHLGLLLGCPFPLLSLATSCHSSNPSSTVSSPLRLSLITLGRVPAPTTCLCPGFSLYAVYPPACLCQSHPLKGRSCMLFIRVGHKL